MLTNNLLELERNESLNKLKLQKKINKLLEIEIKKLNEKITRANHKPSKNDDFIKIRDDSKDTKNILKDLDEKSNDSVEIKIVKKQTPKVYLASYNDKRNAIKKEKSKLYKSFQSQDKLDIANPSPKQSPKVNNYMDYGKRRSFVKESMFKNTKDRNKSANILIKDEEKEKITKELPKKADDQVLKEKNISRNSKLEKREIEISNIEKPSRLMSINISNANNNNILKMYEKTLFDLTKNNNQENCSANFHFKHNLLKNNNLFTLFEIKEDYLLNLASNENDERNSFNPSFDSKFSVEMDYSKSIINRMSSIAKPPTIIDSKLNRSSHF